MVSRHDVKEQIKELDEEIEELTAKNHKLQNQVDLADQNKEDLSA